METSNNEQQTIPHKEEQPPQSFGRPPTKQANIRRSRRLTTPTEEKSLEEKIVLSATIILALISFVVWLRHKNKVTSFEDFPIPKPGETVQYKIGDQEITISTDKKPIKVTPLPPLSSQRPAQPPHPYPQPNYHHHPSQHPYPYPYPPPVMHPHPYPQPNYHHHPSQHPYPYPYPPPVMHPQQYPFPPQPQQSY